MWPARKSTGEMSPVEARPGSYAVSGRNSLDGDYGRDAEGKPFALGDRVKPLAGHEPEGVGDGTLIADGRVVRMVGRRRPGHPRVIWVEFTRAADPRSSLRLALPESALVAVIRR